MKRFANTYKVYYIEEPIYIDDKDYYTIEFTKENINKVVPHLNRNNTDQINALKNVINTLIEGQNITTFISWYYSPMALLFTKHLNPLLTVYDCMDELSAFKFAPPELKQTEQQLMQQADIVFTGGHSLYKAKKNLHHNIYSFPSSIEKEHFAKARNANTEPEDQKHIAHPRFGFFGVLDERFDIDLIQKVAVEKPSWQLIFIGPVVKISEHDLPHSENIHYLGGKEYQQLPYYISSWDIALIPFAMNESTKFISPTKTPEYLAAGKPVISTAIEDVIHPYGDENLVYIIHDAQEFITAAEYELNNNSKEEWLEKADTFIADKSWDNTWQQMQEIISTTINFKQPNNQKKKQAYV